MSTRSVCCIPALVLWIASPALAQEGQAEALRLIACEIRELRSAIQQGQILTPLLEANRREREFGTRQLAELEAQAAKTRAAAEEIRQHLEQVKKELEERKRDVPAAAEAKQVEVEKAHLEVEIARQEQQVQRLWEEEGRLSSAAAQVRARMAGLEEDFGQIQRQMQGLAAGASSVCESGK
jgi:hypothetical protein